MRPRRQLSPWRRHGLFGRVLQGTAWRGLVALLALLALAAPGLFSGATPVAAAPNIRLSAEAAFGGNYRPGNWLPVNVLVANDGSGVTGDVVVEPAAAGTERYVQRVELPTRSQKALTLYALVPDFTTELKVSFTSGKDMVSAAPVTVRALKRDQRLIGVVGDDDRAGGNLASALLGAYGSGVETVTVGIDQLPANTYGLNAFSALVFNDASTGRLGGEQRAALSAWVARGGQLVAATGPNWRKTAEGLADLLPVQPADSRTVSGLAGLSQLVQGRAGPTAGFVVATGRLIDGASRLAEQDGQPLVAMRGWGRGAVVYLAFDPGAPALLTWGDAGAFWRRFGLDAPLLSSLQEPFAAATTGTSGAPGGGASAVDRILRDFPSLGLPPTWLLLLVMLLFVAVVGPVNYLVLRRLDRRELGWLTIPAITLLFAGAIYAVGAGTRGTSVVVNTVSLVRITPGQRAAEAQSFFGVFTPSRGVRHLTVGSQALLAGFGGGGIGQGDLGGDARFVQGGEAAVRDAYFSQWTLKAVAAQGAVDPGPLALRLELRMDGNRIVGRITNPSAEGVEDVVLLLNGRYTRLGSLPAGGSLPVDWLPTAGGGPTYGGLGSTLYYNTSGGYSSASQRKGETAHRANLLDALTGTVLSTGTAAPSRTTRPGTPAAGRAPATGGTGAQGAQPPLQVLYWRDTAPLDLKLGFGSTREVTALVIQETYLGGQTQDRAPVIGGAP